MDQHQPDLLPKDLIPENSIPRKNLVPLWMKIFAWIFIVLGAIAPIGIVFGILHKPFQLSLYGFSTEVPFSLIGVILLMLFVLKGLVAAGLLIGKDWAIKLGLVDAIAGIAACCFAMIYPLVYPDSGTGLVLRLELIALIPYLLKLRKIKPYWENNGTA